MKNSKSAQRMCVGCRQMKEKKDLIRLVRTPEGEYRLDTVGKMNGRGAYICKKAECMEKAVKNNGFQRSFKEKVPKEALTLLSEEIDRRK